MKIVVHMVKGELPDQELDVEGDTSIDRLKTILQDKVGTPAKDLIVLYKGKSLQGAKSIKSYGVEDGTKLYLAVKVPSPTPQTVTAPQPSTAHSSRFDSLLTQFLLKHFSAQDAEKVTRKVRETIGPSLPFPKRTATTLDGLAGQTKTIQEVTAMTYSVESPNLDMIERVAKKNVEMQKIRHP